MAPWSRSARRSSAEARSPAALRSHPSEGALFASALLAASASRPRPRRRADFGSARERTGTPAGCAEGSSATNPDTGVEGFTPNQYLGAYGISTLHDRGYDGSGERIAMIEIDGFARTDIEAFASCFGSTVPPIRTHVVGGGNALAPGFETTLDLSMFVAAAPGVDSIDVYESADGNLALLLAEALTAGRRAPTIISSSLGGCEPDAVRLLGKAINNIRLGLDQLPAALSGSETRLPQQPLSSARASWAEVAGQAAAPTHPGPSARGPRRRARGSPRPTRGWCGVESRKGPVRRPRGARGSPARA